MITFDQYTPDAAGIFLTQQLTKYDWTANDPLVEITWDRDVPRRLDVTITDDYAAYILNNVASVGNISPGGKSWTGKNSTAIAGPAIDVAPIINPVHQWAEFPSWSMRELWQSQFLGRPLDTAKLDAVALKFEMDTDEMVYVGDTDVNVTGLVNNAAVATTPAAGSGTARYFVNKTPDQILVDFNTLLTLVQTNSGYAATPTKVLMPYEILSILVSRLIGTSGSINILEFIKLFSISKANNGVPLMIEGVKWLRAAGAGGSDRMIAYTPNRKYLQFPRVELQRLAIQNRGLDQILPTMGALGVVETRYPETIAYMDYIGPGS